MTNYFENIDNKIDLKAKFKELSKKLHPDVGGSDAEFQKMQQEYEQKLKNLTSKKENIINVIKIFVENPAFDMLFDNYLTPLLSKYQKKYSSELEKNKFILKLLSDDEDQQKFYAEILKNQLAEANFKKFIKKFINELSKNQ